MEELTLSPRAFARPQGRVLRSPALEPAAWALPPVERFNSRPANDASIDTVALEDVPRWAIVVGGGVFAAVMGALLGGALAV